MRRPLLIMIILASLGLGVVILLPDHITMKPSAVLMVWPPQLGDWVKIRDSKPSPQEVAILAKDTDFSKAEYNHIPTNAHVDVGIVLSGMDPNNSIHRPERCLVAQGHSDLVRTHINVPMGNGRDLPVMRLRTRIDRELPSDSGVPVHVRRNFIIYYWFVGNSKLTASHYERTFIDISDRLLHGTNQRWAYITVSITLPDTEEGRATADNPAGIADTILKDFLATIVPGMLDFARLDGTKE